MHFTKKKVKSLLVICLSPLLLAAHSSAMAAEPWEGLFKGTSVLEKGVVLPDGVIFDNQPVELECTAETFQPPFTFIGHCNSYLQVFIPCESNTVITGKYSGAFVDENIQLDDLAQKKFIEGAYSPQDDTWTGVYHFDADNMGCDQYPNVQPFSVYFTVHRPSENNILTPIYHLLL